MKTLIKVLVFILLVLILAGILFLRAREEPVANTVQGPLPAESTPAVSAGSPTAAQPEASEAPEPTPEPTPTPTPEPTPELFTISIIGDETLTSHQNLSDESEYSYNGKMNGDYSYPF